MRTDPARFAVGDEWVYRLRDDAPSQRVRILAIVPKKASVRLDVAFPDDADQPVENVPSGRLRAPWSEVAAFDARIANWQRIGNQKLDDIEVGCVEEVFQLLLAAEVAEVLRSPVSGATCIRDGSRLGELMRLPVEEILAAAEWFDYDGQVLVSPAGSLLIAEALCRANPMPVLDMVVEQETESRQLCKYGSERHSRQGKETTSPEWEYDWYRRRDRPGHELMRQWCGHRAVALQERLIAAEAETHRLDLLVTRLIEALDDAGRKDLARYLAEEHERERITPYNARPVVDRPLHPSEIPVREIRVRRRWAY